MEKIKGLNPYQKGVLIFMIVMTLVFSVVYPVTISKVGFKYMDTILVPSQENGSTVYSGKIQGKQAHFTVSEDKTVLFQHGDKTYGPYTAKEDPAAIPTGMETSETGVELRQGEKILFRGVIWKTVDSYWLFNEDGTMYGTSDRIDSAAPSASAILELMNDPELTHKGVWLAWFEAAAICIVNALSVLYEDELFRWNLGFTIRNVYDAEPSEWEIARRYIGWTVLTITALVIFIVGLQ